MYKQGDIIIVNYLFSDDIKKSKLRPAIIVSNLSSNSLDNDLLICPITTSIRALQFSFLISESDITNPLPRNSEIRCNKIVTLRSSLIIKKISSLHPKSLEKVLTIIQSIFNSQN